MYVRVCNVCMHVSTDVGPVTPERLGGFFHIRHSRVYRFPVNINILVSKIGVIQTVPKTRKTIFSGTTLTVLIKFCGNCLRNACTRY
jgi:hypothetical protein